MARECSVCSHPAHHAIDAALVTGRSCRSIAAEHGLDHRAVDRHRVNHLPQAIRRAAREALAREEATTSATTASNDVPLAPIADARPAPPVVVPEAPPIASSTGRIRRRGMVLDPSAPAVPVATVAPGTLATNVGQPAPAGALDLHEASLDLRRRALSILAQAEADGDLKTALTAIREARGVLEHLSRLEERTGTAGASVPLSQSAEWMRTRGAIVAALADFPDARLAVVEALISTGAAS